MEGEGEQTDASTHDSSDDVGGHQSRDAGQGEVPACNVVFFLHERQEERRHSHR